MSGVVLYDLVVRRLMPMERQALHDGIVVILRHVQDNLLVVVKTAGPSEEGEEGDCAHNSQGDAVTILFHNFIVLVRNFLLFSI